MSIGTLSTTDKAKIQSLIMSGVDTQREIATLREGLRDQVGAIADEMDIEKRFLSKAIRAAYRASAKNQNVIEDAQEELDAVEILLKAAGAA